MRLVVADTGPPHYLVLTGDIELLPKLFGRILIPQAVYDELAERDAPEDVRAWVTQAPYWLEVWPNPDPLEQHDSTSTLDRGERAAIALARAVKADLVLMDDRAGVSVVRGEGLAVTGTLGVLDLAARRGLIDLAEAFERLKGTSFYYRQGLLDTLLAGHRKGNVK
jgi:predicted nucleic acid-binding protein